MPNIKSISDLRNYSDVLKDIAYGDPVYLTYNGIGKYVIMDMTEYKKTRSALKLLGELSKAEHMSDTNNWIPADKVKEILGV